LPRTGNALKWTQEVDMSTATWKVDEGHSGIHFGVRHMMVARISGLFRRWSAELAMDERDLTASSVAIVIDAASVDTANAERDARLRSPSFFDVEQFPEMTFRSRRIERADKDAYRIVGDLTMRGVTKEIVLDGELGGFVVDPRGARRAGFTVRGAVQRADFGMVFNQVLEAGGVAIGDRVEIFVDLEAVAAVARAA
jgi:polyisoprenoid-binding protein YceI